MTVFIKVVSPTTSNKPTVEKKIPVNDVAYREVWNSKNTITVLKPVPDTVAVVVDVPHTKQEQLGVLLSAFAGQKHAHFQSYSIQQLYGAKPAAYGQAIQLAPPADISGATVAFQFAPKKKNTKYLRLEFSPSNLGPKGVLFLKHTLNNELANLLPYKAVEAGTVTRLDVAVDIYGLPPGLTLYRWPGIGKTHLYQGIAGSLETLYFLKQIKPGKISKTSQLKVYDKGQQLADAGSPVSGAISHQRIELTLKPKGLQFCQLGAVQNPLADISIRIPSPVVPNVTADATGDHDDHWRLFVACASRTGVAHALSLLGAKRSAAYKKGLRATSKDAWRPDQLWDGWASSLERLNLS